MAHLYIIFDLIMQTYDLLQSLVNVALERVSFVTKQCKN